MQIYLFSALIFASLSKSYRQQLTAACLEMITVNDCSSTRIKALGSWKATMIHLLRLRFMTLGEFLTSNDSRGTSNNFQTHLEVSFQNL